MKKLIVISNNIYLRNFLQSGALSEIEDKDTYYVASDIVTDLSELRSKKNFLGTIRRSKRADHLYRRILYTILRMANSRKSSSFSLKTRLMTKKRKIIFGLLSLPLIRHAIQHTLLLLFGDNESLRRKITKLQPDIVLIPTVAADSVAISATIICRDLGIPCMHLINGWDNLSSKIVYPILPDYICCWSQQNIEHAKDIHNISPEKAFPIGSPHLDPYFHIDRKKLKNHYPFKYILFAGSQMPFDEITLLRKLDKIMDEEGKGKIKMVYRAHPWARPRSCYDLFEEDKYKHIILDKQIKDFYLHLRKVGKYAKADDYLPSLDYYPSLLYHSKFVISPLSTMMLESTIMGKHVAAIAYDDGVHDFNPKAMLEYEHFKGIETMDSMHVCKSESQLILLFKRFIRDEKAIEMDEKKVREQMKYFLYFDEDSYGKRLKEVLKKLEAQLPSNKLST
jgi:hypothetical protein